MTSACPACTAAPAALELAAAQAGQSFSVPSIRCAGCIGSIERHLAQLTGVTEARVNATLRRVNIVSDLSPERLIDELNSIGYEAYPLDTAVLGSETDTVGRDLIIRTGVAGFAMMNVMLLSVAVWSGATDATRDLFHLVSAGIAIPAVLYSGQPFFQHAWDALRVRRLNMDVPISLAILLAAYMSLYEALHGGAHAYFDAALSLTFFLLVGRYLEHRTRSHARSAANELSALEIHTAQRKAKQGYETVATDTLEIGDIVLVAAGMRVPADGTLLSKTAYSDRAFLTGESEPVTHARGDALNAGEVNMGAPFEMKVTAVGHNTRLRQIASLVETAENARNSYTSLADRAARIYAPVVHLLAAVSFVAWFAPTGDWRVSLNVAIAVLIITCPCALGLAVPAVSTAAISRLYQMGFLVKSGTALERLASVDTAVFDKTGTLTQPGFEFDVDVLTAEERAVAKALAQSSSHPVSRALSRHLGEVAPAVVTEVVEHPGRGVTALWHGEEVALGNVGETVADGLGFSVGSTQHNLTYRETVQDGAQGLADALSKQNVASEVLSGDNAVKTRSLAQRLGFDGWHAEMSPEDKATRMSDHQQSGHNVMMVGDGINDTVALSRAHVSLAPGSALDAARSAADIVMVSNRLGEVPNLIALARKAMHLSHQNFQIAILYNAIAVPIAVAGFATPLMAALAMSASSITVLLNAMRIRWAL